MNPICPYCRRPALLVTGEAIYPHRPDLKTLRFWQCEPCGAYVGCHRHGVGTDAVGRLANAELRAAKQKAHAAFDPLWKHGTMTRSAAYDWLAKRLGIPKERTHIGHFDVPLCESVVRVCAQRLERAAK